MADEGSHNSPRVGSGQTSSHGEIGSTLET